MKRKTMDAKKAAKMAVIGTLSFSLLHAPLSGVYASEGSSGGTSSVTEFQSESVSGGSTVSDPDQAKVSQEEAEAMLRELFPKLNNARLDRVEFGDQHTYPPRGESIWNFQWSISEGNSSHGFNTSVDAMNGEVLSYYFPYGISNGENQPFYPPKVNEEEAKAIAESFLKKTAKTVKLEDLVPEEKMSLQKQLFGPVQYHYYYKVKKNGIPSSMESVSVTIDGNGDITSYHRNRYQGEYPAAVPSITKKQAEEQYKKDFPLVLTYIPEEPYSFRQGSAKWKLAYVPGMMGSFLLDANTGEFIDGMGEVTLSSVNYNSIPSGGSRFRENKGDTITSEQAQAVVTEHADIPEGYRANAYLDTYWMDPGVQVWNINWQDEKAQPGPFFPERFRANVNAQTGQLLHFRKDMYPPYYAQNEQKETPAPAISVQEAQDKAMELIRLLYPNAAEELKLLDKPAEIGSETSEAKFRFQFQRFYGEYPIQNGMVHMTLDGSGKLFSYETSGEPSHMLADRLKGLKASVSPEEALQVYMDALQVELQYAHFGGYYMDSGPVESKMKLVYMPVLNGNPGLGIVDAESGKLQPYYGGSPETEERVIPSDAAGHWASSALITLVEHGVLNVEEDGLLHPDKELSLGNWMLLMSRALYGENLSYYGGRSIDPPFADISPDSEYYGAVQRFIDQRWLDRSPETNLEPEQTLTRERLAAMLVRMLNYSKLAKFMNNDQEIGSLKDAERINDIGSVAIVSSLGLLTPSGGKFNPDSAVTKAQAATIIMRLVKLQGKTDSSVFGY